MKQWMLAAALVAAACGRTDCPQPKPLLIANAGLGEACTFDTNFGTGLVCQIGVYRVSTYESPSFTGNACTVPCDAGACGPGAACTPVANGLTTCLPACSSDGDCAGRLSAQFCDAGHCERSQCLKDSDCPSGYGCQNPAMVCCPPNGKCTFDGLVPGYCRIL